MEHSFTTTIRFINMICNEFNCTLNQINIDPVGLDIKDIDPHEHTISVCIDVALLSKNNYSSEDFYSWCKEQGLVGNITFATHSVYFVFSLA